MNEDMPFSSIAGLMTQALIRNEFSPAVSDAITHKAFPFSPELKQIDEYLYILELFHGPSGRSRDFGFAYLASCLEHILLMSNKTATIVAVSSGAFAVSMAHAFRDKKHIKALVIFPKGTMKGFTDSDCVWNGGNLYPVEVDADENTCFALAESLLENRALVERHSLTVANTANIGRLLPHTFCYLYAFTRLQRHIHSDIFFAVDAGNYGSLTAGLYSWRFSLPVNGFITNCTPELTYDVQHRAEIADSIVPLEKRTKADAAHPSNLERLEAIFYADPAVLRGLVFPARVDERDTADACKDLFMNYGLLLDPDTSRAYAAAKKRAQLIDADNGVTVLVAHDHPALSREKIRHYCGEMPKTPEIFVEQNAPVTPKKKIAPNEAELAACLQEM
jgi:threonine synthase